MNQINDESKYVELQQTRLSTKTSISLVNVYDMKHSREHVGILLI